MPRTALGEENGISLLRGPKRPSRGQRRRRREPMCMRFMSSAHRTGGGHPRRPSRTSDRRPGARNVRCALKGLEIEKPTPSLSSFHAAVCHKTTNGVSGGRACSTGTELVPGSRSKCRPRLSPGPPRDGPQLATRLPELPTRLGTRLDGEPASPPAPGPLWEPPPMQPTAPALQKQKA